MVGYLLVRGGVHIVAYAKAIEAISGVDIGKLLPIPDISNKQFPEARKLQDDAGLHQILYRFSPDDYREIGKIWQGAHPEDGSELRVADGPPQGAVPPDLDEEPQLTAPVGPDLDPGFFQDIAGRVFGDTVGARKR
jgi:Mn-containing catalase